MHTGQSAFKIQEGKEKVKDELKINNPMDDGNIPNSDNEIKNSPQLCKRNKENAASKTLPQENTRSTTDKISKKRGSIKLNIQKKKKKFFNGKNNLGG